MASLRTLAAAALLAAAASAAAVVAPAAVAPRPATAADSAAAAPQPVVAVSAAVPAILAVNTPAAAPAVLAAAVRRPFAAAAAGAPRQVALVAGSDCPFPLTCPWPSGQEWRVGGDGSFWNEEGHHSGDAFAVDCNRVDGEDQGQPISAAAPGVVTLAGSYYGYGLCVIVRHPGAVESLYGHLASLAVRKGQLVTAATVLGTCGSSGWSSGSHLHFLVRHGATPLRPQPLEGRSLRDGMVLKAQAKSDVPGWLLSQPRRLARASTADGLRDGVAVLLRRGSGARLLSFSPGGPAPAWRTSWRGAAGGEGSQAVAADIDGNGRAEVCILARRGARATLTVTDGPARRAPLTLAVPGADASPSSQVVAGDHDGDGRDEMWVLRAEGAKGVALDMVQVDGEWTPAPTTTRSVAARSTRVWRSATWTWDTARIAAGDLDGDGRDEMLVSRLRGVRSSELWLVDWPGATAGPVVSRVARLPAADWYRTAVHVADVDGDARAEMVTFAALGRGRSRVLVLEWPGLAPAAASGGARTLGASWDGSRSLTADVDGDGRGELVLLRRHGERVAGKAMDLGTGETAGLHTLWSRAPWEWSRL